MHTPREGSESNDYCYSPDLESEGKEETPSSATPRHKGKQPMYSPPDYEEEQPASLISSEASDEPHTTVRVGGPSSSKIPPYSKRETTEDLKGGPTLVRHDETLCKPVLAMQSGNSTTRAGLGEPCPSMLPPYSLNRELLKANPLFLNPPEEQHQNSNESKEEPIHNSLLEGISVKKMHPIDSSGVQHPLENLNKLKDLPNNRVDTNCEEIPPSQSHPSSDSLPSHIPTLSRKEEASIPENAHQETDVHLPAVDSGEPRREQNACEPANRNQVRFKNPPSEPYTQSSTLVASTPSSQSLRTGPSVQRGSATPGSDDNDPNQGDVINTGGSAKKKSLSIGSIIKSLRHPRSSLSGRVSMKKLKINKALKTSIASAQENLLEPAHVGETNEDAASPPSNTAGTSNSGAGMYPMKSLRRARSSLTVLTDTIKSKSIFRRTAVQTEHFDPPSGNLRQSFSNSAGGGTSGFNTASIHQSQLSNIPDPPEFTRPSEPESHSFPSSSTHLISPEAGVPSTEGTFDAIEQDPIEQESIEQDPIRVFPAIVYHDVRSSLAFLSSSDISLSLNAISHKQSEYDQQATKIDGLIDTKTIRSQCIPNAAFGKGRPDSREGDRNTLVSEPDTEHDPELGAQLCRTRCREDGNTSLAKDNSFLLSWLESVSTSTCGNLHFKIQSLLDGVGFHKVLAPTEPPVDPGYGRPGSKDNRTALQDQFKINKDSPADLGGNRQQVRSRRAAPSESSPQAPGAVEIGTGRPGPSEVPSESQPQNCDSSSDPIRPAPPELPSSLRLMVEAIDKSSGLEFVQVCEGEHSVKLPLRSSIPSLSPKLFHRDGMRATARTTGRETKPHHRVSRSTGWREDRIPLSRNNEGSSSGSNESGQSEPISSTTAATTCSSLSSIYDRPDFLPARLRHKNGETSSTTATPKQAEAA